MIFEIRYNKVTQVLTNYININITLHTSLTSYLFSFIDTLK